MIENQSTKTNLISTLLRWSVRTVGRIVRVQWLF